MSSRRRRDDWIDDDEYPDDKDIDDFGEDSPVDTHRRTMGRVGKLRDPFWTRKRIILALIALILLLSFALAEILPLLNR